MTQTMILAGVLMVLISSVVRAQPQQAAQAPPAAAGRYVDAVNGLSLREAVRQALAREPSLGAARSEIEVARGMRQQAALRPNPTASFERRAEPGGTDSQTMVSVEMPLDLFRRDARVNAADRELEAVQRGVDDRTRLAVAEVRLRYGAAAAAVRDAAVAEDLAASARRQFELLRQRVAEGASPPLERDLMDVEARRLESERLLAAGRAEAAMHQLRRAAGLPAAAPLRLKDTLEVLVRVGVAGIAESGPSVEDATRIRPDVQAAEVRVHLADAYVRRARSEGRFDVSLFGSYTRMDAGFPQRALGPTGDLERVRGRFQYVAVGAMVVLPLRHRNQGEIAAARAQQASAAANLEAAHLTARAEVAAAAARASQSEQALAPYASGVQLARRNLEVVRQTYELGRMTVSEVLAEQRRYLEMERGYTAAMREAFEARTALQRAKGEL